MVKESLFIVIRIYTKENFIKIKLKDWENLSTRKGTFMMVTFKIMNLMVLVDKYWLMDVNFMVVLEMGSITAMGNISGQIKQHIKENGRRASLMDMANMHGMTAASILVSGKII